MPGSHGTGGRNGVIALIAGLVVLAVVAGVLLFTMGAEDPRSHTEAAAGSTTSSAPSTSAAASGGAGVDFVATLPLDFTDCAGAPLTGDGDVAAADCGAAVTQPGPSRASFHRYPDQATMDAVFDTDLRQLRAPELPADGDCGSSVGSGQWTYPDDRVGGRVVCAITQDGDAMIAWTDDHYLTEGVVETPGRTQQDVATLYAWWSNNSDYQG